MHYKLHSLYCLHWSFLILFLSLTLTLCPMPYIDNSNIANCGSFNDLSGSRTSGISMGRGGMGMGSIGVLSASRSVVNETGLSYICEESDRKDSSNLGSMVLHGDNTYSNMVGGQSLGSQGARRDSTHCDDSFGVVKGLPPIATGSGTGGNSNGNSNSNSNGNSGGNRAKIGIVPNNLNTSDGFVGSVR